MKENFRKNILKEKFLMECLTKVGRCVCVGPRSSFTKPSDGGGLLSDSSVRGTYGMLKIECGVSSTHNSLSTGVTQETDVSQRRLPAVSVIGGGYHGVREDVESGGKGLTHAEDLPKGRNIHAHAIHGAQGKRLRSQRQCGRW